MSPIPDISDLVRFIHFAFSALTLLVGRQEEHLACKNPVTNVGVLWLYVIWLSLSSESWSEVQVVCILSS